MIQIFKYEFLTLLQRPSSWLHSLVFFVIIVSLFPIAIGDVVVLKETSFAIILISVFLSILLSTEGIFKEDLRSGFLDNYFLSENPLFLLVLIKFFIYWLFNSFIIVIFMPILKLFVYFPENSVMLFSLTLFISTININLISIALNALTVNTANNNILSSLLALPFFIPILIISTLIIKTKIFDLDYAFYFWALVSITAVNLLIFPSITTFALKLNLDE